MKPSYPAAIFASILFINSIAIAQQPTFTPSPVMPGKGVFSIQQLFQYRDYGEDKTGQNRNVEDWYSVTNIKYGIRNDLALGVKVPMIYRQLSAPAAGSGNEEGIGDIEVMASWRFYQNDFGPIDNTRAALLIGTELPTSNPPFGSNGVNPIIGATIMHIQGRNGFNAAARWKFNTDARQNSITPGTGEANVLFYDFAYLYRLEPVKYTMETKASLYGVIELNGIYETNSDNEIFISPSLLYEANQYALELAFQFPVSQSIQNKIETDWTATLGLRFLF